RRGAAALSDRVTCSRSIPQSPRNSIAKLSCRPTDQFGETASRPLHGYGVWFRPDGGPFGDEPTHRKVVARLSSESYCSLSNASVPEAELRLVSLGPPKINSKQRSRWHGS